MAWAITLGEWSMTEPKTPPAEEPEQPAPTDTDDDAPITNPPDVKTDEPTE